MDKVEQPLSPVIDFLPVQYSMAGGPCLLFHVLQMGQTILYRRDHSICNQLWDYFFLIGYNKNLLLAFNRDFHVMPFPLLQT